MVVTLRQLQCSLLVEMHNYFVHASDDNLCAYFLMAQDDLGCLTLELQYEKILNNLDYSVLNALKNYCNIWAI